MKPSFHACLLFFLSSLCSLCLCGNFLFANPPVASYLFPAGGQRGTTVKVRAGGLFLYQRCAFELLGPGVTASTELRRMPTAWFEGPLLPLPESQQAEDYPRDMAGEVRIAADASVGPRRGRLWTAEGAATGLSFMVGDLPEVIEQEIDGDSIPVDVRLPITINGRIFPREDVDVWAFTARKGQRITCEVHAARLGSPLDSRLVVLAPDGRQVAENDDGRGADSLLHFTAAMEGKYQVRIHDVKMAGGPAHVYRLTITTDSYVDRVYPLGGRRGTKVSFALAGPGASGQVVDVMLPAAGRDFSQRFAVGGKPANPVLLDLDDVPEHREAEPNDDAAHARRVDLPCVANGIIDRPGDMDCWSFTGRKGEAYTFELRARQLGSSLRGVLTVCDATGKEYGRAEAAGTQLDPTLAFVAPANGTWYVRVADRFRSRGGSAFAYRLRLAAREAPGFRLHLVSDAVTIPRKGRVNLPIRVERSGGFTGPIALTLEGLSPGVTATNTTVGANQNAATVLLVAEAAAPIAARRVTVRGTAPVGTAVATLPRPRGVLAVDTVLAAVALPVPFKVVGAFDLRLAPRGSIFRRRYKVQRNGFTGALEIRLADRQMRHLQGVTGPTVMVPAGANEFEYAVTLPPWMEIGRTSRACIMAVGVIQDGGVGHTVSYSSVGQNDQVIAVVETGRLGLEAEKLSLNVVPGGSVAVPVKVSRGKGLAGPVKVELILPAHVRGVTADPVVIAADQSRGTCRLRFRKEASGPFNMPLVLRATLIGPSGPAVAEAKVEIVLEKGG